ncbi:MAG: YdcF family protein [Phycisphaeraceae bacterium]
MLHWHGGIRSLFPFAMSWIIAAVLATIAWQVCRALPMARRFTWWHRGMILATLIVVALAFPLAQMAAFGPTDYRRHADAAVVMGARAYADGRPSAALADRLATAVSLYHEGYVPRLIMSGGPGDGAVHETQAMRNYAISLGVPAEAIDLDPQGLSTQATASNLTSDDRFAAGRLLVVSHAYHLPRVKLAFQRTGHEVYTVPAHERHTLRKMPYLIAREVAAWWVYYLRLPARPCTI